MEPKKILLALLVCLIVSSGTRAQEYEWQLTYPPSDSIHYMYIFHAIDSWGEVCSAIGTKRVVTNNRDTNVIIVCRSIDGGQTWSEQSLGLPIETNDESGQFGIIQQIDSLHAVVAGKGGAMRKTNDGGKTWSSVNIQSTGDIAAIHFFDSLTGIVVKGTSTQNNSSDTSNIITTQDGGVTWHNAAFCPWDYASMCHAWGGNSFSAIADAWGPIYNTSDDWSSVDSTGYIIPWADTLHVVAYCNFKGRDTIVGYGADWTGITTLGVAPKIFITISTDAGASWSPAKLPDSLLFGTISMSSLNRDVVFLGGISFNYGKYIAMSDDHGITWNIEHYASDFDTTLNFIYSVSVSANNEGIAIFAPATITAISIPLQPTILARGVPVTDAVSVSNVKNDAITAHPNPLAQSTTLSFTSPESGYATVSIVNQLGVEVAQVFSGEIGAGEHSFSWNPNGLPVGTYWCVARMNGSTQSAALSIEP